MPDDTLILNYRLGKSFKVVVLVKTATIIYKCDITWHEVAHGYLLFFALLIYCYFIDLCLPICKV